MNRPLLFARPGAFRLFLAFAVLVSHSTRFDLGTWAVYSFFVLSGYWIHRMWSQKYSRTDQPFRVFYTSRALRILPAFWLMNLVATLVLWSGLTPPDAADHLPPVPLWQAAFSNVFLLGYSALPWAQSGLRVAWSLDVELQFYLLFPLLLVACHQARIGRFVFCALVIIAAAGVGHYLIPVVEPPRDLWAFGVFFTAGALAADRDWRPSATLANASLLLTVAVVAGCWATPTGRLLFENGRHGEVVMMIHWKRAAQLGLALVSIPLALSTVRNPSGAADRTFGELSFTLYLVHWPVMMIHTRFFGDLPPFQRLPSLIAAWGVIALLTWGLYRCFDRPVERRRHLWVATHQRST